MTEEEVLAEVEELKKVYGNGEHPAFFPEFDEEPAEDA